jgi:hypothetical protein
MNREPLAFTVHVGDFKSSWSACTDALFRQRREWFDLSHHAFIFVPGDNEWTDCWRPVGEARDPLERLSRLRQLFFADGYSLGQRKIALERQAPAGKPYTEHARWSVQRVLFVTLNMPGGNNNRARDPAEATERTAAAARWLKSSFARAKEQKLPAVVVMMQANPWNGIGAPRSAYGDLLTALGTEARDYSGEIVVVHGDTHHYRDDRPRIPIAGKLVQRVQRIEVYGAPFVEWVRIAVSEDAAGKITFTPSQGTQPQ